ncbi:MAG: leucyl/phenylalanyl-tRNA--protein transferase [Dehalococcoidia bacterium]
MIEVEVHTARPPQALPACRWTFPDPVGADEARAVAVGGDFAPETIIAAYRQGIFPWPHDQEEYLWFSTDPRAILPIGELKISRRLARTIRSGPFRVTMDAAFGEVLRGCEARPEEEGTWITPAYMEGYEALHALGWSHSFEAWTAAGDLAGGVYGVAVGGMFGAESMFHRVTDASKVALAGLMSHLEQVGFLLVDIQVLTPHTASLGGVEISRREYLGRLQRALAAGRGAQQKPE